MSNGPIWKGLWWLCLVVAPAVLVGIELFHPAGFTMTAGHPHNPGMYEYLSIPEPYDPHSKRWPIPVRTGGFGCT